MSPFQGLLSNLWATIIIPALRAFVVDENLIHTGVNSDLPYLKFTIVNAKPLQLL